jgi:hypothetical protein
MVRDKRREPFGHAARIINMKHVRRPVEHEWLSIAQPGCQQVLPLLPYGGDFVALAAHHEQHRLLDARAFLRGRRGEG